MNHIPNLILHHYTSGHGIQGIVGTDSIWATRIQYMNDSKEFFHAIELASNRLLNMEQNNDDKIFKQFCQHVKNILDSASGLTIYVACFSEIQDSLSQWRGYCPPNFGYSIGFNGERLKTIGQEQDFELRACIYDSQEKNQLIQRWAENSIKFLTDKYKNENNIAEFCRLNSYNILNSFIEFAPFIKHNSFKDEREWRLVSLIPTNDKRKKLRPGKSMLIPHVSVKLNLATDKSLIWNSIVGPTPNLMLALDSLTLLFDKVFLKNGIGHTSIPYREW